MYRLFLILFLTFFCCFNLNAESLKNGVYFTGLSGGSYNFDSKLKIVRPSESYTIDGNYKSRSFTDSPYWAFRVEKWTDDIAYGIELIHHKVYLSNPSESLETFHISDGYNLVLFNKVWRLKDREFFRMGIGGVLAHPHVKFTDSDVFHRNSGLGNAGYFLAGPALQVAFEKWVYETERYFFTLESKLSLSAIQMPVEANQESYASMSNVAIHFTFGMGSKPINWSSSRTQDKIYYFAPAFFPKLMDYTIGYGLHELVTNN